MKRVQNFYDVIYGTFWWCTSHKTTSKRCQSDTQRKLNGFGCLVSECAFANTPCEITLVYTTAPPHKRDDVLFLLSGVRQHQVLTLRQHDVYSVCHFRSSDPVDILHSQSHDRFKVIKVTSVAWYWRFYTRTRVPVGVYGGPQIIFRGFAILWHPWRYFRWVKGFKRTTHLTVSIVLWPLAFYCQADTKAYVRTQMCNIFAVTACCNGSEI